MIISIGILAWNEEKSIQTTIQSLFSQSIFTDPNLNIEVICVPNGCTDQTARIAQTLFQSFQTHHPTLKLQVQELQRGGKTYAWNEYIHRFSDPHAEIIFLMDADIIFGTDITMANMIQTLVNHNHVSVAVDTPLKHLSNQTQQTLGDRISLFFSSITQTKTAQLAGSLYAIRGNMARKIWMPDSYKSFLDDGFIKNMVTTNCLEEQQDMNKIKLAENASHIFQAYTAFRDIWNTQKRQAITNVILYFVLDELKLIKTQQPTLQIGNYIKQLNHTQQNWVQNLVIKKKKSTRFLIMSPNFLFHRYKQYKKLPLITKLTKGNLILLAILFDIVIYLVANYKLRSGKYENVWHDTSTTF